MIDSLDLKLIEELQKDGRQSYLELGKRLHVAEGTVRKRMKRLLQDDIIEIIAVPNVRKLGYNLISAMGIQVRMEELRHVADRLAEKPNVCYLAFVTGRYDLIAIVVTRSSEELSHFIETEISSLKSITRTETFVNLDITKGGRPVIDLVQLVRNLVISQSTAVDKDSGT